MRKYHRLLLLVLLLQTFSVFAEEGLYLGAGLGNATINSTIPTDQQASDIDFRSHDTAYKLYVGMKLANIAFEGGYVNFGNPSKQDTTVELTALDGFGVVHFGLGPIGVFGKIGVVNWDYDVNNPGAHFTKQGTDAAFGVGAQLALGEIGLRMEYELFDVGEVDDLYLFSIGATIMF